MSYHYPITSDRKPGFKGVGGDWPGRYTGGFFLGRRDTDHSSGPVMASAPIQGFPLTRSRCITVTNIALFES
jgi:hypothetical protein